MPEPTNGPLTFSAAWYALRAGWALLHNGEGRALLLAAGCRRLERRADTSSPVVVISRAEQECGGCSGPLTVLLELDLHDERLGFLGLSGECLRVVTCERCVCFGTVYVEVDLAGSARWMEESDRPDVPPDGSYLPERELGLGPSGGRRLRLTPSPTNVAGRRPGGLDTEPRLSAVSAVARFMPSAGQVDLGEFELEEGMIYAFFDPDCGIVATLFQQS